MQSDTVGERILQFVRSKGYQPRQVRELARAMSIGEDEHGDFHAACKALLKSGRIVLGARNAVMAPVPTGKIVGTYRANPRGFGFIIPDSPGEHGDLYVAAGKAHGAITGDTVRATMKKRGKRGGKMLYEGNIVEILKRGRSRFVGELTTQFSKMLVIPDGNTLHVPIVVPDAGAKGAEPGDQVVVEITQYPEERREARGVIVKVLGTRGAPGVDTASIIEQYDLPGEFDEEVLDDARDVVAGFDLGKIAPDREDLRKLTVITIDPPKARDFDDAISITRNSDGTVELGVHIADVSWFVREGRPLDTEARARATSVYLPDKVIPMLPEVLSNGLCSLQEREARLTKSAFITYDRRGRIKSTRVANTLVQSTKRLTYRQVDGILSGRTGRAGKKVLALLAEMERLAGIIRKRRLREGMLVLDLPEVDLVLDDNNAVVDVAPADTGFSHTIIEMFMIEANEAVARLLAERKVPALRRIHAAPGEPADENLRRFLGMLGYKLPDDADRFTLQALLNRVKEKPDAYAVNLAILRSMQRAEYSPRRVGHFALASDDYCHFTSPIRRYPDLTIHRLIDAYLRGVFDDRRGLKKVPAHDELIELGYHCSTHERRAESAERELRLVLLLRLLEGHVGEKFEGIVTGVANPGVFVQLDRFLVDGLLRFDDLPDDWWEVDSSRGAVIGERSGQQIKIGDRLKVVIASIHIPTRQLRLALAAPLKKGRGSAKKRGDGKAPNSPRSAVSRARAGRGRTTADRPRKRGDTKSRRRR